MAELMDVTESIYDKNINPIEVTVVNGASLIWKAEDVFRLRKHHRIIGNLIGCLTRIPFQNTILGLPLQLSTEEVRLLLEKKYAYVSIVRRRELNEILSTELEHENKFKALRTELYEKQIDLFKEEKRVQIISMADSIYDGKKKRYLEKLQGLKGKKKKREAAVIDLSLDVKFPFDRESSIQDELTKINNIPIEACAVQLFNESPWLSEKCKSSTELRFSASETDELRYQVFKDLWDKDMYVTSGSKFGGDFLAYPGDPLRYHAFYIIVCVAHGQKLGNLDLVTLGRLSTQVKKTLVLATLKPDTTVDYISVKWAGNQPL